MSACRGILGPPAQMVRGPKSFLPEPDISGRTYSARLKTASSVTSFTKWSVELQFAVSQRSDVALL